MFRMFPFPGNSQETLRNVRPRAKCAFRFRCKTNPLHVLGPSQSAGLIPIPTGERAVAPRTYVRPMILSS